MPIHHSNIFSKVFALIYQRVLLLSGWMLIWMTVIYFGVSWFLFWLAGEAALVGSWVDFIYFAATTASTVGYGDISPATPAGRLIAAFWFFPGALLIFTASLSKLTSFLIEGVRKMADGLGDYTAVDKATVIIGYHDERTNRMVRDMIAGDDNDRIIILMANQKNVTVPDGVRFVYNNRLDTHEGLSRAACARAAKILVYAESDAETFNICLAVRELNPSVHVAAYFNDASTAIRAEKFAQVDSIVSTSTEMLVRAAQDPGSGAVLMALSSATNKSTIYSAETSKSATLNGKKIGDAIRDYGGTMVAISDSNGGPAFAPFPEILPAETIVYYIAAARFEPETWNEITERSH